MALEDWQGRQVYAEYDSFHLEPESDWYRLRLGQYQGNAGDSLSWHNNKAFTTLDRDKDSYTGLLFSHCSCLFPQGLFMWVTSSDLLLCYQVTVPITRKEAGGTTCVPTPIWMECGIGVDTIAAATRMGSTGRNSTEGPTPWNEFPWWSNPRNIVVMWTCEKEMWSTDVNDSRVWRESNCVCKIKVVFRCLSEAFQWHVCRPWVIGWWPPCIEFSVLQFPDKIDVFSICYELFNKTVPN